MNKFDVVVPVLFGLEAFCAKEIRRLGYTVKSVEDGRVTFEGDIEAVCRSNIWLRTGERVLIKIAEFDAESFEELFESTRTAAWEKWIGRSGAFPVTGYSLKSKLASVRDCQSIIKKSIAARLGEKYGIERLPEDGAVYRIRFSILKNKVTLMLDTSGEGLHKRGYRRVSNAAPLKETIAAAIVMMSYWRYEYPLCDPFCGSGTIPIEAAMIKRNIAPGISRNFAANDFEYFSDEMWTRCREEARAAVKDVPLEIYASDTDAKSVEIATENAKLAGVDRWVKPVEADVRSIAFDMPYGTVICNPPYGERLSEAEECKKLYRDMGNVFSKLDKWNYYILAADEDFEKLFGRAANKKRKVYNGMIKCSIYQYFGEKPPKNFGYGEQKCNTEGKQGI